MLGATQAQQGSTSLNTRNLRRELSARLDCWLRPGKGKHNGGRKQARTFLLRGATSPLQGLFRQRRAALCLRRRRRRRYSAEPGGCPSAARRRATGPLYPVQKVWRRGIQAQTAVTAAVAAIPTAG